MSEQKITIPDNMELVKVSETEYKVVEKKKELPKSWEDFCKTCPIEKQECLIVGSGSLRGRLREVNNELFLPNKEYAEAILALCQLIQLRDCYRQGWKPDYSGGKSNCVVLFANNIPIRETLSNWNQIFAFQSVKVRDKFLNNFKDLIEKTKPLFE